MDLTPYVVGLRADLVAAAEAGGPEASAAAQRLALALDPAVRLALMEALSQAAAEITAELGNGSIDVRLRGREPHFVVDVPSAATPTPVPMAPAPPGPPDPVSSEEREDEDDGVARITLRLPESVKNRAEELAATGGQSLNGWIVGVVRAATRDRTVRGEAAALDLPGVLLPEHGHPPGPQPPRGRGPRRLTGWV